MKEILQINNLNYQKYQDFSINITDDKFVSIIGSNSCGKTTLFKIISCIIPTENVVSCNGILLNKGNVNQYIKQLGVVLPLKKESFLFETVYDEMIYPLKNLGYCKSYIDKQINRILKLFSLDIKDKKIDELTNYEKQVLLIAISLLHKPKLLIIDDIFSFVEFSNSKKIIKILKDIPNLTIIYFSSNLNYIDESDYIYVLDNGKIVIEGDYQSIIDKIQLLADLGLEIPFMIKLSSELQESGIIKKGYHNLEDLVNDVWK